MASSAGAAARKTFAIVLARLPRIADMPGWISLKVDTTDGARAPARVGTLTDAALRSRLSHFDTHSANEIAAARKALAIDSGEVVLYESWPGLAGCLQFWHSFIGSQIRPVEWICEKCGASARESIGGSTGESFPRRCACGQVTRITIPKYGWEQTPPAPK